MYFSNPQTQNKIDFHNFYFLLLNIVKMAFFDWPETAGITWSVSTHHFHARLLTKQMGME